MKKAVIVKMQGIKCDNCTWKDMTVPFKDYLEWLNRPCPACGHSLLTPEDLQTAIYLVQSAENINRKYNSLWNRTLRFFFRDIGEWKHYDVDTHKGLKFTPKPKP